MIEKSLSYKYKVYEKIKEEIITGVYTQGEVLNERKLSETMGVSRTPIREALQMLSTDGWVVNEPYKGTVVRTFDINYVMNAQKVRRVLEILVIEDAVSKISDKNIQELNRILEKQEHWLENYNPKEFMKLDRQFHEKLYYLSKNEILQDLLKNLNDIIRFYGIKVLMVPERNKETLNEHKAILDAIKKRDIEKAKISMDYHLLKTGEAIYKYTFEENGPLESIH